MLGGNAGCRQQQRHAAVAGADNNVTITRADASGQRQPLHGVPGCGAAGRHHCEAVGGGQPAQHG